jgi:hypothetical protein
MIFYLIEMSTISPQVCSHIIIDIWKLKVSSDNALIICNILSMKTETNLSDNYRRINNRLLTQFQSFIIKSHSTLSLEKIYWHFWIVFANLLWYCCRHILLRGGDHSLSVVCHLYHFDTGFCFYVLTITIDYYVICFCKNAILTRLDCITDF